MNFARLTPASARSGKYVYVNMDQVISMLQNPTGQTVITTTPPSASVIVEETPEQIFQQIAQANRV